MHKFVAKREAVSCQLCGDLWRERPEGSLLAVRSSLLLPHLSRASRSSTPARGAASPSTAAASPWPRR